MRSNTLTIRTPEGITFSLPLAGPVTRFLAWVIDALVISIICYFLMVFFFVFAFGGWDLAGALFLIAYFAVSTGYAMALEWYWSGQTLGKRLLGLRVVDAQGLHLQPSQIVIRNLLRFLDSVPFAYFVGGLACLISARAQRLGDLAANTIVVRIPRIGRPDLDQVVAGKYNSFREYPHLAARLRQRVSPDEARLALQALLRRGEFDSADRIGLFARIADHFRSVVTFPQEATEGISDEQYIRNTVDILFRT
jgi:uncharacterized RDD family membrane protein YckC